MEYANFDIEFVERTKYIVETQCKDDFKYDVTLLLNCLVGLVSLPTEYTESGNSWFENQCVHKLDSMGVVYKRINDHKTFRAVKNAISHINLLPKNKDGIVDSIEIWDRKDRNSPIHTKMRFTIAQLKEFALFVADKHLERLNGYKY